MASAGFEAKDLKSWEDAFNYPIATTRQIEKQLRNDIAANKEKLRTLVGSSYHDLLATADRIIHLDERMKETEKLLGDVSLQCNLDVIEQKARHLTELSEQASQHRSGGRNLLAQLSFLQRCQRCVARLLRRGGSVLTAAKVLAVSRLLHKRISQEDDAPPLLDTTRRQLTSQRRRLLAKMDLILISPGSSLQQLVDGICAFCIISSSSSSSAIRHLHELRLDETKRLSYSAENGCEDVVAGFDYYLQSLRTTRHLLGRKFSGAMQELRSQPILRSADIQSLEELDIFRVQQFIPAEILSFVPWIKHPDAGEAEPSAVLKSWSENAFKVVCLGVKRAVDGLSNTSELLNFRAQILQIWLPVSSSTPTHSSSEVLETLRNIFNGRMTDLLRRESTSLQSIASEIEAVVEDDDCSILGSSLPIWDVAFITAPLGKGASSYKQQLTDRHLGQSKITTTILTSLQQWTTSISTSLETIQHLRTTRWIDFIEDDDDDNDDNDDNDKTEQIERTLQKHDPDLYEAEQTSSLHTSTIQFQTRIKSSAETLTKTSHPLKTVFLLRTIRGIYQHLTTTSSTTLCPLQGQDLTTLSSAIPHLHTLLAIDTTTTLFNHLSPPSSSSSLFPNPRKIKFLTHLWQGNPALPTHPSPHVFKLLQRLTAIMAEQGPDLWSPGAVAAVKGATRRRLMEKEEEGPLLAFEPSAAGARNLGLVDDGEAHAAGGGDDVGRHRGPEEETTALLLQALFDLLYLSHALSIPHREVGEAPGLLAFEKRRSSSSSSSSRDADDALPGPPQQGREEAEPLDAAIRRAQAALLLVVATHPDLDCGVAMMATLEGRARDYWARTRGLFGLLG